MYHGVMIGYIINLTIPRSGEVARAGYFSKYHTSSSEKVFGTIVVERVIDLIMLGLVFIIALFLQADRETFNQLRQTSSAGNSPEWLIPLLVALVIIVGIFFVFIPKIRNKAVSFIKGVIEGGMTILKLKQKIIFFIIHTFFIWIAYIAMLWLTALSIPEMESTSINAIFCLFYCRNYCYWSYTGGNRFVSSYGSFCTYKSLSLPIGSCQFFWHNYVVNTDCFYDNFRINFSFCNQKRGLNFIKILIPNSFFCMSSNSEGASIIVSLPLLFLGNAIKSLILS